VAEQADVSDLTNRGLDSSQCRITSIRMPEVSVCARACMCVCVRACVRACVRVCARAPPLSLSRSRLVSRL
jgi:hypothetical protein